MTIRRAPLALLLVALQRPAPFETPIVGGTGGAPFTDRCAKNEVMAGISAQLTNAEVTSIGIVCRSIGSDRALGASLPPRPRHGSAGGTSATAQCPPGQVLRGMAVYYADAVRGLGLYCRVWEGAAFGAAGGASETIGNAAGTMAPVTCPPDGTQPVVGLGGTANARLIAIRLVCDATRR